METLSFVLGIAFVVVIALAVVATYAFVKVIKITGSIKQLTLDMDLRESTIYQNITEETSQIHRRIDDFQKDINSELDSRLDKLENKLTNKSK